MKGGVRLEIRKVDWACVGEKPEHETLSLSCKVAAPGDERYLVCAAGAAWMVSTRNRFLLCALQRVVAHVCVTLFVC